MGQHGKIYKRMTLALKSESKSIKEEWVEICRVIQQLKDEVPLTLIYPDMKSPVNINRLVSNMIGQFGLRGATVLDLDPSYVIDKVKELKSQLIVNPIATINEISMRMLRSLITVYLSSKYVIFNYKLNRVAFDHLIELVKLTFLRSRIHAGENIGVIASQSLGEPTTQLALSAIHHNAQGSKVALSRGTDRLKELMGLSRNQKTPSMTIFIRDEYLLQSNIEGIMSLENFNTQRADSFQREVEYTILRDIISTSKIFYDPVIASSCIEEDLGMIESYYGLIPNREQFIKTLNAHVWLIRLRI